MTYYNHISFPGGSNPFATMNEDAFFEIVKKYELRQVGDRFFVVCGFCGKRASGKERLREFTAMWCESFKDHQYTIEDMTFWGRFFNKYAKEYHLLREFRQYKTLRDNYLI